MIVGTAGHIDHGKTTLVAALTGVDTDRLTEEKKRGISIELGYAYWPIDDQHRVGFIDVPGHEKLVHTMVAGATGIDVAMLVVAADDGIMPQTLEHLAILELLGLQQGVVVLTKADRVSPETLAQRQYALQQQLQTSFLADAPVFTVNAVNPEDKGLEALKRHLQDQAVHTVPVAHNEGFFRLAIDRAFSLAGHGTVVTGTVFDGQLDLSPSAPTQDVRLWPANTPVRIRRLHAQNQLATRATTGQRCAVNVAGVALEEIERGHWLAEAGCFEPSYRIDVAIRLLPDANLPMKTWSPWHVHFGAAHYVAHAVPLDTDTVQPGETALVQFVFTEPVCALPGDRLILRDAQARSTVGGGRVLDPNAPDRKRRAVARVAWLKAIEVWLEQGNLEPLLNLSPFGLDEAWLRRLTHNQLGRLTPDITGDAQWFESLRPPHTRTLIQPQSLQALENHVLQQLQSFHAQHPDEPGVGSNRLRRMCFPTMPPSLWEALVAALLDSGRLARHGAWLHQPEHQVQLPAKDQALAQAVLKASLTGHFDPPWMRDLAEQLEVPEPEMRRLLKRLARAGALFEVVPDLFYHAKVIAELAEVLEQLSQSAVHTPSTAMAFRDATGLGRKRSVQILEFFDRVGYTRRVRNHRVLRSEAWPEPATILD